MTVSESLMRRAVEVIPGGVNSPVRAFAAAGTNPPFIQRANGAYIYDADGHRYVDLVSSWGAIIGGHANTAVMGAATQAMALGSSFGAPTKKEIYLAEEIRNRVPSAEKVRLCNSGTEATMHAIRLARGFTGRDLILKFDGCYHGAHDAVLVSAGSGVATLAIPGSPGIPDSVAANTLVVPFNDLDAVRDVFKAHGDKIAAIIVEPIAGNMGCIPPVPGFLEGLRDVTHEHGSLLIFDEVMTGFRVARGGAQELYGIMPDITTMAKIVGGGFPLAAFAGRADIMDYLAPVGPVYQAGTLSGNPVAVAAGLAALDQLDGSAYDSLERAGQVIEQRLSSALEYHGFSMNRVGSMFTIFFRPEAPTNFAEAKTCDLDAWRRYFLGALNCGVYLPASQFEAAFYSFNLRDRDIDRITDGLEAALVSAVE